MSGREKSKSKILSTTILLIILVISYNIYQIHNFNEFRKAKADMRISTFRRDSHEEYDENRSYKIESQEYNDAVFYKTIEVKPNTPYRVTCMVKTKEVETKDGKNMGGAHISIADTYERSNYITGTHDWQKLEFIFQSKNREQVDIGFRLGGFENDCKGTAWFSDFVIEEGLGDNSSTWNFVCFVFENVDVAIGSRDVKINISADEFRQMEENMSRLKKACEELSRRPNESNL